MAVASKPVILAYAAAKLPFWQATPFGTPFALSTFHAKQNLIFSDSSV
jgi:hypothetical protein